MPGHPSYHAGVFVVYFALHDAVPKAAIVFGRRNQLAQRRRRIEACVRHAEAAENLTPAKTVERLIGKARQRLTKDDEADVAVLGALAGIGLKRSPARGQEKFIAGVRVLE